MLRLREASGSNLGPERVSTEEALSWLSFNPTPHIKLRSLPSQSFPFLLSLIIDAIWH